MKIFNAIRKHAIVLVTLFVIIAMGFVYLFIYIPNNEKLIHEQRFHVLQDIDKNVHEKIENSVALLENLLSAYYDSTKQNDSAQIDAYIKNLPEKNFKIIPKKRIDTTGMPGKDKLDKVHQLQIYDKTQEIFLTYSRLFVNDSLKRRGKNDSTVYEIGMRFTFDQFISALLPQNVFDEYIVFSNRKTVFQTFPAGISYVKGDSLMGLNNGMSRSSLHDFNISGKNYKVFLQPVQFDPETEWVISGLLTSKRYEAEKKQLPFQVILLLITLAVLLIISAPWIKLFHMGGQDRLTVVDGAFSILVSMLLISILFLCFFKYNLPFRREGSPDSKTNLANDISTVFKNEIQGIYLKLKKYNDGVNSQFDSLGKDIVYRKSDKGFFYLKSNDKNDQLKNQLLDEFLSDTSIDHLFWLDSTGQEIFRWAKETTIPPHSNFKFRNYFQNITNNKTYRFTNSDNAIEKFYLDQVISWTSGNFTTILSIPSNSDKTKVAAASFKVTSLTNTILPLGYQFALIDKEGKVLYHSRSTLNLNENLLDKFSAKNELQSCLNAHSEATFRTDYLSRNYNVKVKPLTDLPYFIVIFSDTAYKETRDLVIYSFTFTMLVLFIAFLLIEMLVMFFASAKRSFFKKHLFDTAWIGPKRKMHFEYLVSAAFNIVMMVVLLLLFSLPGFLTYGFILLFSVSFLTLFLHQLYYNRYSEKDTETSNPYKANYKRRAKAILIGWIIIIDLAAMKLLDWHNFGFLLIYEIFVIGISMVIYNYTYKIRDSIVDNTISTKLNLKHRLRNNLLLALKDKNYIRSFTLMIVTRLIITSGIPVVFFYISSYNYEQNVIIRYKQSVFADRLAERLPANGITIADIIKRRPSIYIDGSWIRSIDTVMCLPNSDHYSKEDTATLSVLNGFRPDITNEAIREERFNMLTNSDATFFYNSLLNDACTRNCGSVLYTKTNAPGVYLKLTSTGLNYNPPILFHQKGWLFWLFLLTALLLFYFLLQKIINRLFAIKIPNIAAWHYLDENILSNNKINQRIFVIGAPGVKKRRQILKMINDDIIKTRNNEKLIYLGKGHPDNNFFIADMINIPDSKDDEKGIADWEECKAGITTNTKLVIVSHFEYNLENAYANYQKLNFLESLMLRDLEKIIILSTVHPLAFFDSMLSVGKKKKEKNDGVVESPIAKSDVERWNVLLGHYAIVLMSLGSYQEDGVGVDRQKKVDKYSLEGSIDKEINQVHFLDKMKGPALASAIEVQTEAGNNGSDFNSEELAFKLQLTSHYFYMYIWQSLTKEEKFLLYDLAEDNLVNSFDNHNLGLLIGKGIIYRDDDGTLRIFNKGFRNFILTAIGNSEAMKIKERIKESGSWSKWRTPLMLIFIAILVFLMASQEEVYSELLTYLGALGAAIPLFLKLLSFFDKGGQKTE